VDNITHTLVGVVLAESGLKRASALGTATLALGANLPDVDVAMYFIGSNMDALAFRRGWTHGVVAMVGLPLLLTVIMLGWNRLHRWRRPEGGEGGGGPPVNPRGLLALAAIGVWSHPLLDLLNVYGVRLLMPFSERWFYGDALFIVDPWVWLVLLAGLALARRSPGRPARLALGVVGAYALTMAVTARTGSATISEQTGTSARTMVAPVFGNPFRRDVIRDLGHRYETGALSLGLRSSYTATRVVSPGRDVPGAAEASTTHDGMRFLRWARFPRFESRPDTSQGARSTQVRISDLRFAQRGGFWASVAIAVPDRGALEGAR